MLQFINFLSQMNLCRRSSCRHRGRLQLSRESEGTTKILYTSVHFSVTANNHRSACTKCFTQRTYEHHIFWNSSPVMRNEPTAIFSDPAHPMHIIKIKM